MTCIVSESSDIKGFDCRPDLATQTPGFLGGMRFDGRGTDLIELRGKNRVSAEQECIGAMGLFQAPGGFRKTGGGEIKQAQFLEQFKPIHGGIERIYQTCGRLQFERRQLRVILQSG